MQWNEPTIQKYKSNVIARLTFSNPHFCIFYFEFFLFNDWNTRESDEYYKFCMPVQLLVHTYAYNIYIYSHFIWVVKNAFICWKKQECLKEFIILYFMQFKWCNSLVEINWCLFLCYNVIFWWSYGKL